jgi:hypothetical protein
VYLGLSSLRRLFDSEVNERNPGRQSLQLFCHLYRGDVRRESVSTEQVEIRVFGAATETSFSLIGTRTVPCTSTTSLPPIFRTTIMRFTGLSRTVIAFPVLAN